MKSQTTESPIVSHRTKNWRAGSEPGAVGSGRRQHQDRVDGEDLESGHRLHRGVVRVRSLLWTHVFRALSPSLHDCGCERENMIKFSRSRSCFSGGGGTAALPLLQASAWHAPSVQCPSGRDYEPRNYSENAPRGRHFGRAELADLAALGLSDSGPSGQPLYQVFVPGEGCFTVS